MAQCEFCNQRPAMGNQIETRGKAKYLGGVGTKITGITRREFKPNLQRVKITTPNGTNKYVRICTRCLKAGVIRKAVKGMLPRNKLAAAQLRKLKVYAGPEHPHAAQSPQTMEL